MQTFSQLLILGPAHNHFGDSGASILDLGHVRLHVDFKTTHFHKSQFLKRNLPASNPPNLLLLPYNQLT